jgi:hypothetical protein
LWEFVFPYCTSKAKFLPTFPCPALLRISPVVYCEHTERACVS